MDIHEKYEYWLTFDDNTKNELESITDKKEIEDSFGPLSAAGVKLHLGKGAICKETIELLKQHNSVFAVIPPTTALFESQTFEREIIGWPELGMEALHRIRIHGFQAIIAAAHGESIY